MGVVNNRIDIDALAKSSGGGGGGGGGGECAMDLLYTEEATPKASTSSITLSASSADYKALLIQYKKSNSTAIYTAICGAEQGLDNYTVGMRVTGIDAIAFNPSGTSLGWSYNNNSSLTWYAVYGIK